MEREEYGRTRRRPGIKADFKADVLQYHRRRSIVSPSSCVDSGAVTSAAYVRVAIKGRGGRGGIGISEHQ